LIWESPFSDLPQETKRKRTQVATQKISVFLAFIFVKSCENAKDIDTKMGNKSSKTPSGESQTDSFEESPYLGPSGLHLGLQTPTISVSQGLCQLQGEVFRQTRSLQQVSNISYEGFLASITELNEISTHFLDSNGKQLVFAVKKGSDSSFLWKATVRIACVKLDAASKNIDSYRCLNLKQYLRVFNALKTQTAAVNAPIGEVDPKDQAATSGSGESGGIEPETVQETDAAVLDVAKVDVTDAKELLKALTDADPNSLDECCICLERKPDVILPCTHSYCLPCIEQWNVDHKTCPVCRETLSSTDDGWVISEGPDSLDIATEIQKNLMELATHN